MIDLTKFTADIRVAKAQAREAIKGMDDGGTCNFDALFLPTGKGHQIGRASPKVEAAIEAAGADCWHKKHGSRKGYVVNLGVGGQGATRTKAMEVVCKALEVAGYETETWYQMD